jgi:hypothetical protein
MRFQNGRVQGPALGGVLAAAGGAVHGLFVKGASSLAPAQLLLALLPTPRAPQRAGEAGPSVPH